MRYEPLDDLTNTNESRYRLTVAVAKRARQLVARKEQSVLSAHKPVTVALKEILDGKVKIVPRSRNEGAFDHSKSAA